MTGRPTASGAVSGLLAGLTAMLTTAIAILAVTAPPAASVVTQDRPVPDPPARTSSATKSVGAPAGGPGAEGSTGRSPARGADPAPEGGPTDPLDQDGGT